MTRLTSKIQYKNFETGEFVEEKKRNLDETIEIIEKFPWEKERDKIVIDLTNPSITIEGNNHDYIKLAVYFNRKFVLHYVDDKQTLFDKSFIDIRDSYKYLENYFAGTFDTADFNKQNTWLKKNLKHFISQDFIYTVNSERIKKYLWSTSAISFAYSIFTILIIPAIIGIHLNDIVIFLVILPSVFFIGGGMNLILFFNYYSHCKDKILIMSKGNDLFFYGNINSPVKYNKNNILQFTLIVEGGNGSPVQGFAFIKIEFKNGTILNIPNLLVDHFNLGEKLFQCRKIYRDTFLPYIKT